MFNIDSRFLLLGILLSLLFYQSAWMGSVDFKSLEPCNWQECCSRVFCQWSLQKYLSLNLFSYFQVWPGSVDKLAVQCRPHWFQSNQVMCSTGAQCSNSRPNLKASSKRKDIRTFYDSAGWFYGFYFASLCFVTQKWGIFEYSTIVLVCFTAFTLFRFASLFLVTQKKGYSSILR